MYNKSIKRLMMKRIKMTKFGILFSRLSMSARSNSVFIVSISLIGSTKPLTWVIFSFSKHLTIWTNASTSLILPKNWFPRPSPLEAPSTNPAISTNVMRVWIIFFDELIFDNLNNLLSGTSTSPTFGSIVQKG